MTLSLPPLIDVQNLLLTLLCQHFTLKKNQHPSHDVREPKERLSSLGSLLFCGGYLEMFVPPTLTAVLPAAPRLCSPVWFYLWIPHGYPNVWVKQHCWSFVFCCDTFSTKGHVDVSEYWLVFIKPIALTLTRKLLGICKVRYLFKDVLPLLVYMSSGLLSSMWHLEHVGVCMVKLS